MSESWTRALDNPVEKLDAEVIPICEALNILPGVETISSCCGHGFAPFRIYFIAQSVDSLKPILAAIDESEIWSMRVSMATGNMEPYFILESRTQGEAAYHQANELAIVLEAGNE